LKWRSESEVDNLGFNVYREANGQRTKINPQIIAGSALITGPKVTLAAGNSYAWGDELKQNSGVRYWLEAIDTKGTSTWTGPINLNQKAGRAPSIDQSVLLTRIGLASAQMSLGQGSATAERKATIAIAAPSTIGLNTEFAGKPAVKLGVKQEGWYRIGYNELVAAGLSTTVNARTLQLYVDGRPVPMIVNGEQDGRFDSSDTVEFYGMGLDAASSDTRVYWLVAGSQPGLRIDKVNAKGSPGASASFSYTVERKGRTIYFSGLRNGDTENFFGPVISREPVDQSLTLQHVYPAAANAQLEVALQGVTQQLHNVKVLLNGAEAGSVVFDGQTPGVATLPVSHGNLKNGDNVVRLIAQAGETDVSLVNSVRITYQHSFTADDNALRLTANAADQVTLDGFTSRDVRMFDVTNPDAVQSLQR